MIALPRYVIDYNERCRPDLTCAYTRSEEAEENGPNEGTRKRSVTTHVALVQRREPDFFWVRGYTLLSGFARNDVIIISAVSNTPFWKLLKRCSKSNAISRHDAEFDALSPTAAHVLLRLKK